MSCAARVVIAVDVDAVEFSFDASCSTYSTQAHNVDAQLFAWLASFDLATAVELQDVLDVDHEHGCTCRPSVTIWRARTATVPAAARASHSDDCQIGAW